MCLASASMMAKVVENMPIEDAQELSNIMHEWINGQDIPEPNIPDELRALAAVKAHSARKKCVLLAWNAVSEIIQTQLS